MIVNHLNVPFFNLISWIAFLLLSAEICAFISKKVHSVIRGDNKQCLLLGSISSKYTYFTTISFFLKGSLLIAGVEYSCRIASLWVFEVKNKFFD